MTSPLHHIPPQVLDRHIAVLAMNGAGKTYGVKGTVVEPLLKDGKRVCIIDPTGVYWGLRLEPQGKAPSGLDVVIFGGPFADFTIGEEHGEAVAEVIATTSRSAIIDTSDLTVGQRTRFFAAFAETLLRKNRAPLYLVVDEAHLFAPQGRVNDPQSGRMLHAANNLVSLGRARGLRITLISQRPAKLHKDSLTQAHSLVVMKLVAPQDREAAEAWIEGQPDRKRGAEVLGSLAGLGVGNGWLWAPEIDVLSRIQFPKIRTFDSSRAPDDNEGERLHLPKLETADIQAKIEAVASEVAANDPAQLKKRIADLEAKLAFMGDSHVDAANNAAEQFAAGERAGYDRAFAMGVATFTEMWSQVLGIIAPIKIAVEQLEHWYEHHFDNVDGRSAKELGVGTLFDAPAEDWQRLDHHEFSSGSSPGQQRVASTPVRSVHPPKSPLPGRAATVPARRHDGNGRDKVLSPAQLRILDALAWLESIGVQTAPREITAFLADASPRSSAYANNLGALRSGGYLDYAQGSLALTSKGRGTAERPAKPLNHRAMMDHVLARLEPAQGRILAAVAEAYPRTLAREQIARAASASHTSSAFANNLGRLRSLGLITYQPNKGVRADDRLYP